MIRRIRRGYLSESNKLFFGSVWVYKSAHGIQLLSVYVKRKAHNNIINNACAARTVYNIKSEPIAVALLTGSDERADSITYQFVYCATASRQHSNRKNNHT